MKLQRLGLGFFVVFALSGALVASAAAEETRTLKWLVFGEQLSGSLPVETRGEFLLEDSNGPIGKAGMVCSLSFDGTIKGGGEGSITELLSAAGVKIGELGATALLCKSETGCENSSTDVEAWPKSLPWQLLVIEMTFLKEVLVIINKMKFQLACLVLGVKAEDECSAEETGFLAKNGSGEVELTGPALPNGNCSLGGEKTGVLEVPLAAMTSTGTLSISE